MGNIGIVLNNFYEQNILTYIKMYQEYPVKLISLILDIVIVIFLAYELLRIVKDSRAWQLVKGIAFLVIATALSGILNLHILNYILSSVMTYGMFLLIVVFQPELRRGLEQIGSTNRFSRLFGLDKDLEGCIQKVGIVRYSAFQDTGSDLSFSLALLDEKDNGVVMNGIYSREMSNIYAKPVEAGKSSYTLSEEEQQAIKKAMEVGKR